MNKTLETTYIDETGGVLSLSYDAPHYIITLSNINPIYHEELYRTIYRSKGFKAYYDIIRGETGGVNCTNGTCSSCLSS